MLFRIRRVLTDEQNVKMKAMHDHDRNERDRSDRERKERERKGKGHDDFRSRPDFNISGFRRL